MITHIIICNIQYSICVRDAFAKLLSGGTNNEMNSNITINSELKNVNVTIYDKAGNGKEISCVLQKNNTNIVDKPIISEKNI